MTTTAILNRTTLNAQITSHKNLSYNGGLCESRLEELKKQVLRSMISMDEHEMLEVLKNLDKGIGFRWKLTQG